MSTVLEEITTAEDAASSVLQRPVSEANTPTSRPFQWWNAVPIINKRLGGSARAVAKAIAEKTYKDGIKKATLPEIAEWSSCNESTVRRAMPEILASGLLNRKRTRDGYVYTWTTEAYGSGDKRTSSDKSTRSGVLGGADLDSSAAERLALAESTLVRRYLSKRKSRYGGDPSAPSSRQQAAMSQRTRDFVLPDIVFAASRRNDVQNFEEALEKTVDAVLGFFFANDGDKEWLKKREHPLDAMWRDMPQIMSAVSKLKAYRAPEIRDEKLERIASDVSAHKCACGHQATRYWLGKEGNRESGTYTCSKRECSPFAEVNNEHEQTRLGEKNLGAVDVSEVLRPNREEAAPLGVELVHAVLDTRASNGTAKMSAVSREPAAKPTRKDSPEVGRIKGIFARHERLQNISAEVLEGLLELFHPDDLIRVVPEAAKEMPQGQTIPQIKAWFFKRMHAKAA